MTRLQKKCLVASSGAHGLLLLTLLVAAVFHSEQGVSEERVLTLISPRILDRDGSGGEAPSIVMPQPVAPPSHPAQEEPVPQPRVATQPPKAVTVSVPKPRAEKTISEKPSTSKPAPRHEVTVDLTHPIRGSAPVKPSDSSATPARSASDTRAQEFAQTFVDLGSKVRASAAPATVVTMPGEGGGEAFVGYETAIYNAYFHAWQPDKSTSSQAAEVKIVVARDGSIVSAEIISRSGDPVMDRSVQRVLDAVKQLPPFPTTTTDTQRSFRISFSPEAKQTSG